MAHIEKRGPSRWRARYRGPDGKERSRTFARKAEAERFLAAVETSKARGEWLDPLSGSITVREWCEAWLPTRTDLRAATRARLETTVERQVLPKWGGRRLSSVTNGEVRAWVGELLAAGYSPATARKAVFALRQMFDAAVADRRLSVNAAASVPLPPERASEPRALTRDEVLAVADAMHPRYRAAVLLGGFGGLRYGELMGLRRKRIDVLRGRITVAETAVELGGAITFGEPKTPKSKRTLPIPRTLMRALEDHLAEYVGPDADALVFTVPSGGPVHRATFARYWRQAVRGAGLEDVRVHDLRHSYVSLLIAGGASVKEVSTWAGHSSAAFTLDRYSHLFDTSGDEVSDRLDALFGAAPTAEVRTLRPAADGGS